MTRSKKLLQVKNLSITFKNRDCITRAVKGIHFDLESGKTLAVVGESGSGKSVTGLSMTQLLHPPPACEVNGEILFEGNNVLDFNRRELRKLRGKQIAYIFQEPSSSLNPVFTVGYQIAEAVKLHLPGVKDVPAKVIDALKKVGIRDAQKRYKAYPHEMSGGMQQRVMIAMALACEPKLLIADEPTTALDVTIQKQIMDLLKTIRHELAMSIILITHNFSIIQDFADDVLVMLGGEIVEQGPIDAVMNNPQHDYTKALIACIPKLGAKQKRLVTIDHDTIK